MIDALAALRAYDRLTERRGPTIREYQEALGLSSSSVAAYRIHKLVGLGWLDTPRSAGESRGYHITEAGEAALREG